MIPIYLILNVLLLLLFSFDKHGIHSFIRFIHSWLLRLLSIVYIQCIEYNKRYHYCYTERRDKIVNL